MRRQSLHRRIELRSQIAASIRRHLSALNFL
ncbi:MAG: hypothetical protein ACKVJG_05405 [Candidatus Latescibacterota bacterium]